MDQQNRKINRRSRIEQQLENFQQQYQKWQNQIFQVVDIASEKNLLQEYNHFSKKITRFLEENYQKDIRNLGDDNQVVKNQLYKLNNKLQKFIKQALSQMLISFDKKKLQTGNFQKFYKNLSSYLVSTQDRSYIPSLHQIPKNFIIVPKITFTSIIHAIKSTNINKYINYSVYYQYNRLMEYLAKTRYQNYQNLSENIKKQIGNENIQQLISKIYYTHSNFLKKDFTQIKYQTYSFETMYRFSSSTKQMQMIQIHSALLQEFSFKKSLFNHIEQTMWNSQQYQQLKQLIQFFDSFFKINQGKFKEKQQVYRRIMNALIKLNQNLNITAQQQIQYDKKQINQKFYRFRQLSKKFYFHHQKLEFQNQKLKLLQQMNSQQIQQSSLIIKNLCQIMIVGIMTKTVQYNNIAIKLRQTIGQSLIFQMQLYKWKIFLQFQIKTQDQNSTFIRLKAEILIPQKKLLNIKKKNVQYIPQLLENLTQQLYTKFIFQIIQKNGFYVQLWFEQIAELKITKFQAVSPSITPLNYSSNYSLFNHFWFANFIYNTSSLQNYFWKSQSSIHVSFRKIWTVYAKGFISNYQKTHNIDLSQFNCYQQAIIILNVQLGNPLKKDEYQTNTHFITRLKQSQNIRQIIVNQDAYNLVHIFNINVFFDDQQFSHLNIFTSDNPLHLIIYSCHAQLSHNLPQYLNKEKQNKRKIHNVSQFSLQMIKGQVKPAKTIKNNLLQQLKMDYDKFKSNKINTQFGYFDLQTYACKDQIMQIYLSVLVCFVPQSVCIQMNKHLQISQQTYLGWVKVHIILTQQCVLFEWFGRKCQSIAQLTAWIMVSLSDLHYVSFKKPITWWTFNGLSFDYSYILNSMIKFTNYLWSFGVGRQCKGMKNKYLVLQDARNFFPAGNLKKLTWQNNIKYKKQNVKIQLITSFNQFNQNRDLIINYCIYDCLSLQQLIIRFYKNLYSMSINSFIQYRKQQISKNQRLYDNISLSNIIKRPTASNFALYFFKMVFLKQSYKVFDSPQQIEQQKLSFSGGMVQVIRHFPHNQKIFQGDANSMYPSNMKYLPIWPYQDKFWQVYTSQQIKKRFVNDVNNKKWLRQFLFDKQVDLFYSNNKDYFQQQDQRQKSHQNFYNALTNRYLIRYTNYHHKILPFISKKHQNSLFYNNQVNAYRWVSGFAILHLLTHDCQVVIQKVRCRSSFKLGKYENPFYAFASLCYNQRLIYKKNKQNGLADCFKLMLNSLYGKFLQQLFNKIKIFSSEFQNSQYKKIIKQAEQFFYSQCQQQNYKFSGDLITIASTITQISRVKVSQLVFMLGQKNCFYSDTDSLYFNDVGKTIFEKLSLLFYERQWGCQQGFKQKSLSGKQLGQWKIQNPLSPFKDGIFISRKCLLLVTDQIQTQNKEKININQQNKLKLMYIEQNTGNQMFQYEQVQFQKWKRDKFSKVRLKGINIKPNYEQTQLIIKVAKQTYKQQVKIPNFSEQYGIFSSLQIPLKFSTQQWKRQFYKINSGVKIIDQIKRISFNFKRFPKIDGRTKPFQTFDTIFAGFQK